MPAVRSKSASPSGGQSREERTRAEILSATRALVERHGFAKVTLEDIAGALGKKKSFLYYYYADKEAILVAMVEREMAEINAAIESAVDRERTGRDKLSTYILRTHQEIRDRLTIISHLRREIQAREHGSFVLLLDQSRKLMRTDVPRLEALLREGVADGSLRPLAPFEIEAIANFTVLALHGIEYDYVLGGSDEHIDEYLKIAIRTLEHGLAP